MVIFGVGDGVALGEGEGEALSFALAFGVAEGEAEGAADAEALGDGPGVGDAFGDAEGLGEAEALGVGLSVGPGVGEEGVGVISAASSGGSELRSPVAAGLGVGASDTSSVGSGLVSASGCVLTSGAGAPLDGVGSGCSPVRWINSLASPISSDTAGP